LSVRDPDKWFESTRETILSDGIRELTSLTPDKEFFQETVFKDYVGHFGDRAFITSYFKRHNEEVQRAIPKERLLVYDVSQGWEPLCKFLGVPVPKTAFPHVNVRQDFDAMMAAMRQSLKSNNLDQVRRQVSDVHEQKR